MKIEFLDKTIKMANRILPFSLLCISTIILTVLAFIMLPLILIYKFLDSWLSKREVGLQVYEDEQVYKEHSNAYTYYIRGPEE
jgi:hypothetical protein